MLSHTLGIYKAISSVNYILIYKYYLSSNYWNPITGLLNYNPIGRLRRATHCRPIICCLVWCGAPSTAIHVKISGRSFMNDHRWQKTLPFFVTRCIKWKDAYDKSYLIANESLLILCHSPWTSDASFSSITQSFTGCLFWPSFKLVAKWPRKVSRFLWFSHSSFSQI